MGTTFNAITAHFRANKPTFSERLFRDGIKIPYKTSFTPVELTVFLYDTTKTIAGWILEKGKRVAAFTGKALGRSFKGTPVLFVFPRMEVALEQLGNLWPILASKSPNDDPYFWKKSGVNTAGTTGAAGKSGADTVGKRPADRHRFQPPQSPQADN